MVLCHFDGVDAVDAAFIACLGVAASTHAGSLSHGLRGLVVKAANYGVVLDSLAEVGIVTVTLCALLGTSRSSYGSFVGILPTSCGGLAMGKAVLVEGVFDILQCSLGGR